MSETRQLGVKRNKMAPYVYYLKYGMDRETVQVLFAPSKEKPQRITSLSYSHKIPSRNATRGQQSTNKAWHLKGAVILFFLFLNYKQPTFSLLFK